MKMKDLLLVDDDETICSIVSAVLEDKFDIRTAHDGYTAVQMIQQQPPAIILCDIVMDRGDGYSVIEFLRSREEFNEIPIVMMTSLTDRDLQRKGMHLGADDIIQKPFTEQELMLSLNARLRRYELEQQLHNTVGELNSLFETLPDMFFRITKLGDIVEQYGNNRTLLMFSSLQTAHRNILTMFPETSRDEMNRRMESVLQNQTIEYLEFGISDDNGPRYFEVRVMPFRIKEELLCVIRDITEKKLNEEALKLSENKFSTVFFSSPSMMCIYGRDSGCFIDVNEAFCENTRYSPDELLGSPISQSKIFNWQLLEGIQTSRLTLKQFMGSVEIEYVTKNGEVRFGMLQYETIEVHEMPCILFFIMDVTTEKEHEKALMERYDIFKQLTDAIDDVLWIHDTDGRIVYYKPSTKYAPFPLSVIGKKPSDDGLKDIFSTNIRNVVESNQTVMSAESFTIHEEDILFTMQWTPICNEANKVIAVSVIAKVTLQKDVHQPESVKQNELFQKIFMKLRMYRHGESLLMIINRLLLFSRNADQFSKLASLENGDTGETNIVRRITIVINEYLTRVYPELNTLVMYSQLLSELSLREFKDNSFHKTTENILKLNKFNYDYLKMILSGTGGKKRSPGPFLNESIELFYHNLKELKLSIVKLNKSIKQNYTCDVNQTVLDVVHSIRSDSGEYRITVHPTEMQLLGIIRRSELSEVMMIILKNAIEAFSLSSDRQEGPSIDIIISVQGEYAYIKILDNGPGIAHHVKNEIFSFGTSSKNTGHGFGLYYTQNIIKEYGGRISFTENEPTGTIFTINLLMP